MQNHQLSLRYLWNVLATNDSSGVTDLIRNRPIQSQDNLPNLHISLNC